MPKYRNSFASTDSKKETIIDSKGRILGTIRIKPVSISWKPANQSKFFTVNIEDFIKWITNPQTKARKTK